MSRAVLVNQTTTPLKIYSGTGNTLSNKREEAVVSGGYGGSFECVTLYIRLAHKKETHLSDPSHVINILQLLSESVASPAKHSLVLMAFVLRKSPRSMNMFESCSSLQRLLIRRPIGYYFL